jgi:hypothetical protein
LDLLPPKIEWAFPPVAALGLTFCFLPACVLLLSHRIRWTWLTALAFVFFAAFLSVQQYSYAHLEKAEIGTGVRQCPWLSASGLTEIASRAFFIPSDLQVDVNDEQCMSLRLAHDSGTDWETYEAKAYDPKYIKIHYAQNVAFPMAVLVRDFMARRIEISKNPSAISRWSDRAVLGYRMLEAILFVLERQDRKIQAESPGWNPVAIAAKKVLAWEEKLVLKKISATLFAKVGQAFSSERTEIASAEKTHPETEAKLSEYERRLDALQKRVDDLIESY